MPAGQVSLHSPSLGGLLADDAMTGCTGYDTAFVLDSSRSLRTDPAAVLSSPSSGIRYDPSRSPMSSRTEPMSSRATQHGSSHYALDNAALHLHRPQFAHSSKSKPWRPSARIWAQVVRRTGT